MKINKNDLPITMQTPDTIMRAQANLGGMTVCFNEVPADTDFSPLLKGLENDSCHCPHWGYLLEGKIQVKYVNGKEETIEAGDIFYMPPGHTGKILETVKVIEFNPTKEFNEVGAHVEKMIAGLSANPSVSDLKDTLKDM